MNERKLRLDVDELAVETFEADREDKRLGTVHGHAISDTTCFQVMCDCSFAGEASCVNTCGCQGGGSQNCSVGCPGTRDETCCTGFQIMCSCPF